MDDGDDSEDNVHAFQNESEGNKNVEIHQENKPIVSPILNNDGNLQKK